jgi:hypothetical protein
MTARNCKPRTGDKPAKAAGATALPRRFVEAWRSKVMMVRLSQIPETPALEPGAALGRFAVIRLIGRGGMGEV